MNKFHVICIVPIVLFAVQFSEVYGLSNSEKELSIEMQKALSRRSRKDISEVITKMKDESISDTFRLNYCRKFLLTRISDRLDKEGFKAVSEVLAHTYNKNAKNRKITKIIISTVTDALKKVKRNEDAFIGLMDFFAEIEIKEALPRIRNLLPRFNKNAAVLCAGFKALENIREKESISIIDSILYREMKKTEENENITAKELGFYQRIEKYAVKTLKSLTGRDINSVEGFHNWWINNRASFKVPPRPKEEKEKKEEEKDKEENDDEEQSGEEEDQPESTQDEQEQDE